jgi:DNA-3-methyladenine glycosylase
VARARALTRRFFDRDALEVAPELLNKVLAGNGVSARLVEVEAYRADEDPGSHAFRGRTPRNASMFASPGTLYVYFSYGNHWCMNAVCGPGEQAHAVLLRAAAPLSGLDVMRLRRHDPERDRDLASGPGRLGEAFGADRALDGTDPPAQPGVSTRIGLAPGKGDDLPYRFYVPGDPNISRPPRT